MFVLTVYKIHTTHTHCINIDIVKQHFNRSIIISYHQSGLENRKLNFKTSSNTLARTLSSPPPVVTFTITFVVVTWLMANTIKLILKVLHSLFVFVFVFVIEVWNILSRKILTQRVRTNIIIGLTCTAYILQSISNVYTKYDMLSIF